MREEIDHWRISYHINVFNDNVFTNLKDAAIHAAKLEEKRFYVGAIDNKRFAIYIFNKVLKTAKNC